MVWALRLDLKCLCAKEPCIIFCSQVHFSRIKCKLSLWELMYWTSLFLNSFFSFLILFQIIKSKKSNQIKEICKLWMLVYIWWRFFKILNIVDFSYSPRQASCSSSSTSSSGSMKNNNVPLCVFVLAHCFGALGHTCKFVR